MRKILAALLLVALSGCASANVQRYASVDGSEKTVMVPPGGGGLSGKIKSRLSDSGWKLSVFRGPEVTVGSVGASTNVSTSDTFNTRYILAVDSNPFDICFNFQTAVYYDISLIDSKTGTEVVTMSGRGCEDDIATEFMKQLQ